jgi:hypothetical protein
MPSVGTLRLPEPVKLFAGVLVAESGLVPLVEERLIAAFGPVDHRSDLIPFDFTDYYAEAMGDVLERIFFSFRNLVEADALAPTKLETNRIENETWPSGADVARPVNVDPGYIEQSKVVLASTKNFYHRVYLRDGVFAEITMHFKNNTFQFFPWTYPDYESRDYQEFFLRMRQIYRSQLKRLKAGAAR